MSLRIIGYLLLILVIGCSAQQADLTPVRLGEDITLVTEDDVNLNGSFYQKGSSKAIVLVHMLDSDRHSYDTLVSLLNEDHGVLAIDSRGHGESDLDWNDFSAKDFNNMVLDVKAAKKFLVEGGYSEIYLIGASIGANTVLNYAAIDNSITKIVLLSPGLDYRGVSAEESIEKYENRILIVASEEDDYPFSSSEQLYQDSIGEKKFIKLQNQGHGTSMLDGGLMEEIASWLES